MNLVRRIVRLWLIVIGCGPLVSGCARSQNDEAPAGLIARAGVSLDPRVLDDFVGTYQLPSGALFPVIREGDRLLGGTPPSELLPQTTRRFASNRLAGEFCFERSAGGQVSRMSYRQAKQDHWAPRVDPLQTADPTQLVDAGGHRLRMLVAGEGQPTIVLEDGFGNGIDVQTALHAKLSQLTRVVAYDHAATGGSESGPQPRDARQVARELRTALARAGLAPPFVFVGGSIGADYIRVFAHEFPSDVAAAVLLDPTPDWEELLAWIRTHAPEHIAICERIVAESSRAMDELMRLQESGRQAEWTALSATRQQAREAFPLPDIPIVQITGAAGRLTSALMHCKVRFFDDWLSRNIPTARHVLAHHSAHAVPITDADLVVEEVRRIVLGLREPQ
jgi:pimeloyl-ACP methyl ester carboxylesterase